MSLRVLQVSAVRTPMRCKYDPWIKSKPTQPHWLRSQNYATHREDSASSLLSTSLDQNPNRQPVHSRETVGPFALGLSQQSLQNQEKVKKWSELSTGGKVMRTTARTTNFTVIILGAGLSAVLIYALTSELFSKNSPTVLYGDACDRIKASNFVSQYLNGPLVFHNNPPSAVRPRHRNRHVSSQIFVDSTGREHMLMNFYVKGRPPGSKPVPFEMSYFDSLIEWMGSKASVMSDLSLDESISWSKEQAASAWERSKRAFKYLSGAPVPPPPLPPAQAQTTKESPKAESSIWSFAGLFSGLKGPKPAATAAYLERDGHIWTEGEVHADLIRNDDGYFVFRYIIIDIPDSRSRNPIRVFVERAPGVRESESVLRWNT